ncbi:MAG: 50S ribosomal protein L31 [bacterium]
MKNDIHPQYYTKAKITCACGETIITGSTVESIAVELCSKCHPFYTGKQKIVDTARRVEKFEERAGKVGTALDHKAKAAKKIQRAKARAEKKAKADNA